MKCLLDGDMIAFRTAASAEGEEEAWVACSRADSFIDEILSQTGCEEYEVWLSGKNNFRYLAYPEYKANRKDKAQPRWRRDVEEFLRTTHNAQTIEGAEADDALGSRQDDNTIIVTNDKDLKQIAGKHYNPVTKTLFTITPEEGTRFFYYQMLVGDATDNIKGALGIGKVKAEKLLSQCVSEEQMREAVINCYSCEEEYHLNATCLWIWHPGQKTYNGLD